MGMHHVFTVFEKCVGTLSRLFNKQAFHKYVHKCFHKYGPSPQNDDFADDFALFHGADSRLSFSDYKIKNDGLFNNCWFLKVDLQKTLSLDRAGGN